MTFKKAITFVLYIIAAIAAVSAVLFTVEAAGEYRHKGELQLAEEHIPPGEADATQKLINDLKDVLIASDPATDPMPGRTPRGAHAKQHGLVKAEFTVVDDLAPQYRVGLFKEPGSYKAWIRFSSLSGKDPDTKKGARGLAIKLMGVPGRKILPGKTHATTHDFVFMSTPFFVSKDVAGFSGLLDGLRSGKVGTLTYFLTHPRMFMLVNKSSAHHADLFGVEWSSATPYLFGDGAVKYAIRPRLASTLSMPGEDASPHFLRERLVERLSREDVILDFYIQLQRDAKTMPIEDPRIRWNEAHAPLVRVASIRVFKQEFDTPVQHYYGDQLSFTTWHALPEHRPLGGVNRGRREIYLALSKFRHARNGDVVNEPTDWQDFAHE